jgi:hypothetical protein
MVAISGAPDRPSTPSKPSNENNGSASDRTRGNTGNNTGVSSRSDDPTNHGDINSGGSSGSTTTTYVDYSTGRREEVTISSPPTGSTNPDSSGTPSDLDTSKKSQPTIGSLFEAHKYLAELAIDTLSDKLNSLEDKINPEKEKPEEGDSLSRPESDRTFLEKIADTTRKAMDLFNEMPEYTDRKLMENLRAQYGPVVDVVKDKYNRTPMEILEASAHFINAAIKTGLPKEHFAGISFIEGKWNLEDLYGVTKYIAGMYTGKKDVTDPEIQNQAVIKYHNILAGRGTYTYKGKTYHEGYNLGYDDHGLLANAHNKGGPYVKELIAGSKVDKDWGDPLYVDKYETVHQHLISPEEEIELNPFDEEYLRATIGEDFREFLGFQN